MQHILCSIAAACLALSIVACGANTPLEPTVYRATQQFNVLKERPNTDQVIAHYEEMYTSARQQLTAAFPFLRWQQTQAPGGAACGPEFAALNPGSTIRTRPNTRLRHRRQYNHDLHHRLPSHRRGQKARVPGSRLTDDPSPFAPTLTGKQSRGRANRDHRLGVVVWRPHRRHGD